MVSNHVFDLLQKYDKAQLPERLTSYLERREFYDYSEHSRMGAAHGEFVDDETCDRFCILGSVEDHIEKLRELEAIGVTQWNIYLMTENPEETLELYGTEIIPKLREAGIEA
jgi:alkanesulfonate monooxygenase SsuD/methylene tetrahydromethanopterin reductase-like flavin-dependent oxidoreductase (luciferase family)